MTQTITITNTKGGVGKTAVAANLALSALAVSRRVLLVDADPQGSLVDFLAVRDEALPSPAFQAITHSRIHHEIDDLAVGFDYIFIDAGGRDSPVVRSAIAAADRILVPITPTASAVWALQQTLALLRGAEKQAEVIPTLVGHTNEDRDGLVLLGEILDEFDGATLVAAPLYRRVAWGAPLERASASLSRSPTARPPQNL